MAFFDGATDVKYVTRAMSLLRAPKNLMGIELRQGGGDNNLKHAWKVLTAADVLEQTVVLFHDCDSNILPSERGNVHRRIIPLIDENPVHRGIENLFSKHTLERAMTHKSAFVDIASKHEATERGTRKIIPEQWKVNDDEKNNLCEWLCENGTAEDFQYFQVIIDELGRIPGISRANANDPVDEHSAR